MQKPAKKMPKTCHNLPKTSQKHAKTCQNLPKTCPMGLFFWMVHIFGKLFNWLRL